MKLTTRILSLALCLVLVLPFVPQSRADDESRFLWENGLPYVIENGEASIPWFDWWEHTFPRFSDDIVIPDTLGGYPVTKIVGFHGHRSMVTVSIPASVRTIHTVAFRNCGKLTNITVAKDNSHFSSENGVLFNKTKTTLIQYPRGKPGNSYVIPKSVKTITNEAFYGASIKNVTIPNNVVKIGGGAFKSTNLTYVTIPNNVVKIGRGGFSYTIIYCKKNSAAHKWAKRERPFFSFSKPGKAAKLTFNAGKGKIGKKSKVTVKNKVGKKIKFPKKPKRKGYKFMGWYTKKKGGIEIKKKYPDWWMYYHSFVLETKKTYYARWRKK